MLQSCSDPSDASKSSKCNDDLIMGNVCSVAAFIKVLLVWRLSSALSAPLSPPSASSPSHF